jgi:hypothetical protein
MDPNERANLPVTGGSQTVEPSTNLDTSDDYSGVWEPDSDDEEDFGGVADNPAGAAEETDSETGEADTGQETGEDVGADDETGEAGNEEQSDETKLDETVVTLHGGEQVPIKELKLGYLRHRDYSVKTQELGNRGRVLHEMSERVGNTAATIAQFLVDQLPPEPSPALAMQNPDEYTRQRVMFETATQRVNQILEMANVPKEVVGNLTKEQHASLLKEESTKLAQVFPHTTDPAKRETFFQNAFSTARDLGFSDEELQGATDHRLFALAHYARLGLQAQAARKKAMNKVNNAPPPVAKGRVQGGTTAQVQKQKVAMDRLKQSGSIDDAVKVDWA